MARRTARSLPDPCRAIVEGNVTMARHNTTTQAIEKSSANNVQVHESQPQDTQPRRDWTFAPSVDIHDAGNEWVLVADIPGADPQNINITREDRVLTLHAPVQPRSPQSPPWRHLEYNVGDYYRTFRLGEDIDSEGVHAEYQHGVLTLHLPKAQRARPRKIPISAS
jgi:HSP20 family protein